MVCLACVFRRAAGRIPCIYFYSRNIAGVDSLQSPFQCLGAWGISIPHKMNIPAARGCTRPRHYSWIITPQWWLKGPGSGCLSPFQWSTLEGLQAHVIPLGSLPLLCLNFSMPARLHAPRAGTRKNLISLAAGSLPSAPRAYHLKGAGTPQKRSTSSVQRSVTILGDRKKQ